MIVNESDTICAISTPSGVGGIAVIRVSGTDAIAITETVWKGKPLAAVNSHSAHLGDIVDPENPSEVLDTAVATVYRAPRSFTGENVVELSVHGSRWIQRELVNLLIRRGCRMAEPGEFTRRAFANGHLDLAQAEAVADVIAASSRSAHRLAASQMRGEFSKHIGELRDRLVEIASLLELELDFSEEDVEFASRQQLRELADVLLGKVSSLASSFSMGAALKDGVPVAIVGEPNVGKSTLLNVLLKDNRAIVSDIPGTTRDTIEDAVEINGVLYRFIDTAGIRETADSIENLGIERSYAAIKRARIVVWLITPDISPEKFRKMRDLIDYHLAEGAGLIIVINKIDTVKEEDDKNSEDAFIHSDDFPALLAMSGENEKQLIPNDMPVERVSNLTIKELLQNMSVDGGPNSTIKELLQNKTVIPISASNGQNIEKLITALYLHSGAEETENCDLIVTNARHYEALTNAKSSLERVISGIEQNLSGDFIAQDLRETIHHLSSITGTITTDTLLQNIFQKFCIGK